MENLMKQQPIVIAIDGTKRERQEHERQLVARALGYVYVDTGPCTGRWHGIACKSGWTCMTPKPWPPPAANGRRGWSAPRPAGCGRAPAGGSVIFPKKKSARRRPPRLCHMCRRAESAGMDEKNAARVHPFGNLVMEGATSARTFFRKRITSFTSTPIWTSARAAAADGVKNLAARDQRDSQRASAPLISRWGQGHQQLEPDSEQTSG